MCLEAELAERHHGLPQPSLITQTAKPQRRESERGQDEVIDWDSDVVAFAVGELGLRIGGVLRYAVLRVQDQGIRL